MIQAQDYRISAHCHHRGGASRTVFDSEMKATAERGFLLLVALRQTAGATTMKLSKIIGAAVWIAMSTAAMAQTGGYPASPSHGIIGNSGPDGYPPRYGKEPANTSETCGPTLALRCPSGSTRTCQFSSHRRTCSERGGNLYLPRKALDLAFRGQIWAIARQATAEMISANDGSHRVKN
jgi:hypothetical protein